MVKYFCFPPYRRHHTAAGEEIYEVTGRKSSMSLDEIHEISEQAAGVYGAAFAVGYLAGIGPEIGQGIEED